MSNNTPKKTPLKGDGGKRAAIGAALLGAVAAGPVAMAPTEARAEACPTTFVCKGKAGDNSFSKASGISPDCGDKWVNFCSNPNNKRPAPTNTGGTADNDDAKQARERAARKAKEKKAREEAKVKAEAEAKEKAEAEEKAKAEAEAKVKAEAEAKVKAEAEAKVKAEAEAKVKAEADTEAKVTLEQRKDALRKEIKSISDKIKKDPNKEQERLKIGEKFEENSKITDLKARVLDLESIRDSLIKLYQKGKTTTAEKGGGEEKESEGGFPWKWGISLLALLGLARGKKYLTDEKKKAVNAALKKKDDELLGRPQGSSAKK